MKQEKISNFITYIALTILSFIWLFPIAWLVMQSFRGEGGAFTSYIIPKTWTLNNYIKLFTETRLFNFPKWFMNTLYVSVFSCAITTIIVLLTSYTFSRLRFKT